MSWVSVIAEAELPEDAKHKAVIDGWHVLIVRTEDGKFAINDRCTHQASLLSTGRIRRGAIMCPLHGARFEVVSGKCLGGGYSNLRTFALRVVDGMIEVELPETKPGIDDLPITLRPSQ